MCLLPISTGLQGSDPALRHGPEAAGLDHHPVFNFVYTTTGSGDTGPAGKNPPDG